VTPTGAPSNVRHRVAAFTLALIAVAYLDRVCIATAAPAMKADLGLSDVQMGFVFSAFTFAYALFEVPSGWLADRYGARVTLTRIVIWWSALTAATGLATGFASLLALRLLFGIGEAGTFPATARVYARWLPYGERGRAFGLAIMTGAFGGAATQPLVVSLLGVMTWRHVFALFGLVGLVWASAWWRWFRDDPHQHPGVNDAELRVIAGGVAVATASHPAHSPTPHGDHARVPWARLATNRTLIALCGMYAGVIYGWYFYLTWLPTYLLRARGFDLKQVGWLAALPLVAIGIGVCAGGWISDHLTRRWGARAGRRTPGVIGLPLAAVAIVLAVVTANPMHSALFLAAAAGLAALGVAPAWAVCLEIGGRHAGVVSGAMNTFGNLGGTVSPAVVGLALERWGSWHLPLYSVAALYVVSGLCWLAIDPQRRIAVADE
jgi:ACS family glucarate transporter-like MFS transporter